jgi:hypothetical protein
MLTKMIVMVPGAAPREAMGDLPDEPGLDELRTLLTPLLNGGEMEHVSVLYRGRAADMFADENGVEKRLARNEEATAHYRRCSMYLEPEADPEQFPAIYGPAVLFERKVWS